MAAAASICAWMLGVFGCATVSRGSSRNERHAAFALACLALLAPLGFPAELVLARAVLTAFGLLACFRGLDLILRPSSLSTRERVWLLVAGFDVRRAERVAPHFDFGEARWLSGHVLVLALASWAIVTFTPSLDGPAHWVVRWGCGAGFCFALVEVIQSTLLIAYALAGISLPRINDFPIRSTTLVEFWGRRWNRVVAGWLRDYLFFPLARRRRPTLGIIAAFAGSTALHFWIAWLPLDLLAGLSMASFFMVQALGLLLERRLGVNEWPLARRRTWTIAWLLLSSPLFVEPALQIYFSRANENANERPVRVGTLPPQPQKSVALGAIEPKARNTPAPYAWTPSVQAQSPVL